MNTVLGFYSLVEVDITNGVLDMEEAMKKVPAEYVPNSIYQLQMTPTVATIIFHCGKAISNRTSDYN